MVPPAYVTEWSDLSRTNYQRARTGACSWRRIQEDWADLVAILCSWKASQNAERLLLGPDYASHNLVFTIPGGGPVDVDNLRRRDFARLVESAGVPRVRLHDLRHGFASLLLGAGFDLKLVSDLMGHSTVSTTADVYGHLALGPKREAANVLGRLLSVAGTG